MPTKNLERRRHQLEIIGNIFLIIGVICTAFDITPINKILSGTGNGFWGIAGYMSKNNNLIFISFLFLGIYIVGFIYG